MPFVWRSAPTSQSKRFHVVDASRHKLQILLAFCTRLFQCFNDLLQAFCMQNFKQGITLNRKSLVAFCLKWRWIPSSNHPKNRLKCSNILSMNFTLVCWPSRFRRLTKTLKLRLAICYVEISCYVEHQFLAIINFWSSFIVFSKFIQINIVLIFQKGKSSCDNRRS